MAVGLDHEVPFIFLVEDNPDDELLTLRALRTIERHCDIRTAHDGAEATAFFDNEENPIPALVLLDLKLPKLNGIEVLQRIRANPRHAHVPVVVLTSSNERIDVNQCYDLGANSYIQKPVEFESFIETVRLLGLYWVLKNVHP